MSKKSAGKNSHSIVGGTIVILIVTLALFTGVIYWMYTVDILFLPDFVEEFLGINEQPAEETWQLDELSELVRDRRYNEGESVSFDETYENLRAALLGKEKSEGIFISAAVSYYDEGEAVLNRVVYRRDGGRFSCRIYSDSSFAELAVTKIGDNGSIYIRDEVTGESRTLVWDEDISPEHEAGIPSIEELLAVVSGFPAEAGGTGDESIRDCELMLLKPTGMTDGMYYYIAFTYSELGIREEYYVSLDDCMIIALNTTKGGKTIYSYEAVSCLTDPYHWDNDSFYEIAS